MIYLNDRVWLRQIMIMTLTSRPARQPRYPCWERIPDGNSPNIPFLTPPEIQGALLNIPDTGRLIKYWLPMIQNSSSRYPNWELASGIRFDYPFLGENRKNWIDIFHPPLHCSPNWHSDWPIRGQYFCHVTINDQSEASIYAHRGTRYHRV